jgi:hypothetical protein
MSGKRIRLTDRRRQAVDTPGTPYPGTVNQPDRQFKEHAQYNNWKEVVNHPLPDMRHEWKREMTPAGRDEIGFGIPQPTASQPTVASINIAADKSVRAAVLLLGEKVAETIVEEQARDFMLMGGEALDRTLARFTATEDAYKVTASDDEDDDDDDDDAKEASDEEKDEKSDDAKEAADDKEEKKDEEDAKEASTELAVAAEGNPTTIPEQPAESTGSQEGKQKGASEQFDADVQAKIAELKVEVEAQAANREAYNQKVMEAAKQALSNVASTPVAPVATPVAPVAGEMDFAFSERVAGPNEMDIELTATMDSEVSPDPQADAMLAGLFDDGTPAAADLPVPGQGREASAKQGINSLGGQPKIASANAGNPADISSIWDSAPDVSEIFK